MLFNLRSCTRLHSKSRNNLFKVENRERSEGCACLSQLHDLATSHLVIAVLLTRASPRDAIDRMTAPSHPGLQRFDTAPEEFIEDGPVQPVPVSPQSSRIKMNRSSASTFSTVSKQSVPPPGSVLTGKQEHCMCLYH